jgi:hypothetical protein
MISGEKESIPGSPAAFGPKAIGGDSSGLGPVWYVTNGAVVVGPVGTDLLLRGITSSRIPNDCMVAQPNWGAWRPIDRIREISRIARPFSWAKTEAELAPGIPERLVRRARDAGEALLFAMNAAVKATCASAALVHRVREPFVGLVTSSAHGPGSFEQLGHVVPHADPALEWAKLGEVFLGSTHEGPPDPVERAIFRRLSLYPRALAGVAMVPVFDGGRLMAMVELGREEHPFRSEDATVLKRIADVVCER